MNNTLGSKNPGRRSSSAGLMRRRSRVKHPSFDALEDRPLLSGVTLTASNGSTATALLQYAVTGFPGTEFPITFNYTTQTTVYASTPPPPVGGLASATAAIAEGLGFDFYYEESDVSFEGGQLVTGSIPSSGQYTTNFITDRTGQIFLQALTSVSAPQPQDTAQSSVTFNFSDAGVSIPLSISSQFPNLTITREALPGAPATQVYPHVPPTGSLIAYRPMEHDDSSINLHNYPIPEAEKSSNGVGIRVDGGGLSFPSPDNDLIEMDADVSDIAPSRYSYFVKSDNDNVEIWNDSLKTSLLLGGAGQSNFSPTSLQQALWVEWDGTDSGTATITLLAKDNETGAVTNLDTVNFHTFKSDTIIFSGEHFGSGGTVSGQGGMLTVDKYLYALGYDTQLFYPEDYALAFTDASNGVIKRGVMQLALIGHSHGGGAAYNIAAELRADSAVLSTGRLNIAFASYVDAIEYTSLIDFVPEYEAPPSASFVLNFYETSSNLHGVAILNSNVLNFNMDRYNLDHHSIALSQIVQQAIEKNFLMHVEI